MNLYQKLNQARLKLQNTNLKKSGRNKHLNFDYFELQDFLPTVNDINNELGICTNYNLVDGMATLTVFNSEKPDEQLTFTTVTAQAKLQGNASPIQEIGSLITYTRRYLYIMAYEISENDMLDAQIGDTGNKNIKSNTNTNTPAKTSPTTNNEVLIEEKHRKALYANYKNKKLADDEFKKIMLELVKKESTKDLNIKEFKILMEYLEKLEVK